MNLTPTMVVLATVASFVVVLGVILAVGHRRPKTWHDSSGWLFGGFLTTIGLAVTADVAWLASDDGLAFLLASSLLKLVAVTLAVTAWLQVRRASKSR